MWVCAALFPSCDGAVESAVESSDREALRLPDHSEAQQNQLPNFSEFFGGSSPTVRNVQDLAARENRKV